MVVSALSGSRTLFVARLRLQHSEMMIVVIQKVRAPIERSSAVIVVRAG